MLCKGCGEELRYWDYIALSMCKTCYVIDDMDRFVEYKSGKMDKDEYEKQLDYDYAEHEDYRP